ncbi:hypothetical protein UlMin_007968 [Ulmus minor]
MSNGEGTGKGSSEVASPKPSDSVSQWRDDKSDGDDGASSRYSSFGDSEFERYCSANSALGTPSMCSTITVYNDTAESEFGSLRNLGFGDDGGGLENFSLGGMIERNRDEVRGLGDRRIEFSNERSSVCDVEQPSMNYGSSGFELFGSDELTLSSEVDPGALNVNDIMSWKVDSDSSPFKEILEGNDHSDGEDSGEEDEEVAVERRGVEEIGGKSSADYVASRETKSSDQVGNDSQVSPEVEKCSSSPIERDEFKPESDVDDMNEMERLEDGTFLRDEHSEGEDSMYNHGTDDEEKVEIDHHMNMNYHREAKAKTENPLLINSSVAFGSEVGNGSQVSPEVEKCSSGPIERDEFKPESDADDMKETERLEDGTSSRDEHSEGEDSMYNYGTDGEDKVDINHHMNMNYHKEVKAKTENPLLINSSVAFGSEDWDDFMQESGETSLGSATLTMSAFQQENDETGWKPLNSTAATSIGFPSIHQNEEFKNVSDMPATSNQVQDDHKISGIVNCSVAPAVSSEDVRDIPVASYEVQGTADLVEVTKSCFTTPAVLPNVQEPEQDNTSDIPFTSSQVQDADEFADYSKDCSLDNIFETKLDPLAEKLPEKTSSDIINKDMSKMDQSMITEDSINVIDSQVLETMDSKVIMDSLDDILSTNEVRSYSTVSPGNTEAEFIEEYKPKTDPSTFKNNMRMNPPVSEDQIGDRPAPVKTNVIELNEFYDEVVLEMEEILLDSRESPGAKFSHSNRAIQSKPSLPLRDGGSSASTSGTDDANPFIQHPMRIDGIEVIGARQKKGDVSFSERLVGVKEYTVYKIRVWSGKDQWEVERRYRDFFTLYRRLKSLFANHGWSLPSPWEAVEKESRKIFGNASPDVVAERSILIQECLRSVLHHRFPNSSPGALIWFLSPQDSIPSSPGSNTVAIQSNSGGDSENISTLGNTISLIVEIQPYKSMKQMLEAQHYTCAGCYKHFDDGKTLIGDFAQTLGWGKPRLCEYTSQLFCSSCHTNETAVLPARVLHNWDFTQYPVSQLAKSYLDSILDQPMLCVSAVNPFLFSKVPTLQHVMGVRRKIGSILPYVRCPFRVSINKGLGSRRYLLESNDFFALRDLVDLSKGAFAALPVMVETILKKIVEHITEQCLVCCDVGIPCSARQACNDPSALIFPFQEGDVEKCSSCESIFHKHCYKKLTNCPCGAQLQDDVTLGITTKRLSRGSSPETSGALEFLGQGLGSGLQVSFLSKLFPKTKPEKKSENKDSDNNVILMGSMPSSSL